MVVADPERRQRRRSARNAAKAIREAIAEKLRTPPDQQLLALEGKPLQAHVLDTERPLAAHGIAGPVSLTLSPQPAPGAAELTAALKAEAEASLRAAIEPCARPARMKLRKAGTARTSTGAGSG